MGHYEDNEMTPVKYLSRACTGVSSTNALMKRKLDFMLFYPCSWLSLESGCCVTPTRTSPLRSGYATADVSEKSQAGCTPGAVGLGALVRK